MPKYAIDCKLNSNLPSIECDAQQSRTAGKNLKYPINTANKILGKRQQLKQISSTKAHQTQISNNKVKSKPYM